jgi:hypothetical protein
MEPRRQRCEAVERAPLFRLGQVGLTPTGSTCTPNLIWVLAYFDQACKPSPARCRGRVLTLTRRTSNGVFHYTNWTRWPVASEGR